MNDYEVTNIRPETQVNERGDLIDYYAIFFTTKHGDSSFVRVPRALSAEEIRRGVADEAKKLIELREATS